MSKALLVLVLLPLLADATLLRRATPVPKTAVKPVQLSAGQLKLAHSGCTDACRTSSGPVDSHCVTACEAAYFTCNDEICKTAVLKKFKETKGVEPKKEKKEGKKGKGGKDGEKKEEKKEAKKKEKKSALITPKTVQPPLHLSAEEQKIAHFGCTDVCRTSSGTPNSHCVTGCEADYYNCMDVVCREKVLAEYKKSKGMPVKKEKKEDKKDKKGGKKKGGDKKKEEKKKEKKSAALIAPKQANQPLQLSAEQKKHAHFGCMDACRHADGSPTSSYCVTSCEAKYYQCMDELCQAKVLEDYAKTKGITQKEEKKKGDKDGKKSKKDDKKKGEKKEKKKSL